MKSRVLRAADFRCIELEVPRFKPDMEALNRELDRLARMNASWAEGAAASEGDVVECSLSSALPRFDRPRVRIAAGSGLFDRRIEDALLGRAPGRASLWSWTATPSPSPCSA